MSDAFRVDASEIFALARNCAAAAALVPHELTTAMTRSVIHVEADAKRIVPTDTHILQRSITHDVQAQGQGVVGKVGTNVPYGKIVEEGRTPGGLPPPGVLRGWMARHGIPLGHPLFRKDEGDGYYSIELRVAKKINAAKKPRPYLKPALAKNLAAIDREFQQVIPRILAKLGGR